MENDNDVHLIQNLSVLLFATPPEKQILDWMGFFYGIWLCRQFEHFRRWHEIQIQLN